MPSHDHGGKTSYSPAGTYATYWSAYLGTGSIPYPYPRVPAQGNHLHGINTDGGDQPHNNIQPSAVVLKIIKY